MTNIILKIKGSNSVYNKKDNLLYLSPLKVPESSVCVKVSLSLSQNKEITAFLKGARFLGHPVHWEWYEPDVDPHNFQRTFGEFESPSIFEDQQHKETLTHICRVDFSILIK